MKKKPQRVLKNKRRTMKNKIRGFPTSNKTYNYYQLFMLAM